MSFRDDALGMGRESIKVELARDAAQKEHRLAMVRRDFDAAKKAVISWMFEIEMTPVPKIECEHLGDAFWNTDSDKPIDLARRVRVSWIFDEHQYIAEYQTDDRLFPIGIVINVDYPTNPRQYREIRGGVGRDWSSEEDKIRIGRALLEEQGDI